MALFIYLLLGLGIITYELTRKKSFLIDPLTLFNFFFFLVYVIAPTALILFGNHLILDDMPYGKYYFGKNSLTPFIVLAGYLFFIAGYESFNRLKTQYTFSVDLKLDDKKILFLIIFTNVVLYLFLLVYVWEFGGLLRAIELAQTYRSGAMQWHKFDFVLRFFSINTILLYYTFYKFFLEKKSSLRGYFLILFIIAFIFTLIATSLQSSRGFFIFQISGLYALTVIYNKNFYLRYMIPTIFFVILFILYGRIFFQSTEYFFKEGWDAFVAAFSQRVEIEHQQKSSIISNFTHAVVSLEAALKHSGYDTPLRYFRDIKDAFTNLLPNELLGIEEAKMQLMDINTLLLQGKAANIVLPGILGYFVYAAQVSGVFIGMFIYGAVGAMLNKFFTTLFKSCKGSIVFFYILCIAYGYFAFRGVVGQVLNEQFGLMLVVFILLIFAKIEIKSTSKFYKNEPSLHF